MPLTVSDETSLDAGIGRNGGTIPRAGIRDVSRSSVPTAGVSASCVPAHSTYFQRF